MQQRQAVFQQPGQSRAGAKPRRPEEGLAAARQRLDAAIRLDPPGGPLDGWAFAPTVVTGLGHGGRLAQEEVFGPLATVVEFDDEDDAVRLANDTAYGLSCVVFTESIKRAHTVASRLRCGTVWVNCYQVRDLRAPMGGPGNSGIGREGGNFSREFFTEPQAVFLATS